MPSNPPSSGQKLRNSCDSCNLAKVKCSKARPSCTRCEAQGVRCIYGVSLRAGKHRAKGSNIQKPRPESPPPSSRVSKKESSPPLTYPSEGPEAFDRSLPSFTDPMVMNGDWSSILADEYNPYLMDNGMDLDDSNLNQQQFPKPLSDCNYMGQLTLDPVNLMYHGILPSVAYPDSPSQHSTTSSSFRSGSQPSANTTVNPPPCSCSQKILHQLLAFSKTPELPAEFDTALNQNKQVINLCHSILNDKTHHHHDISFVLTLTALINKVITVYDTIYNPYRHPNTNPPFSPSHLQNLHDLEMSAADSMDMASPPSGLPTLANNSPYSSSTSLSGMATPRSSALPMRLTLGSYRLDEQDEEKLKWDIFKLELSKVAALVRAFEQRFCDASNLQEQKQQQSKYEVKAYEDMVYYLQKRLRVSLEMPKEVAAGYA